MKYYAIAYGHVIRWEKATSSGAAAHQAFGMVDTECMTVREFPRNPKYMKRDDITKFQKALAGRHKEKTGSVIA